MQLLLDDYEDDVDVNAWAMESLDLDGDDGAAMDTGKEYGGESIDDMCAWRSEAQTCTRTTTGPSF